MSVVAPDAWLAVSSLPPYSESCAGDARSDVSGLGGRSKSALRLPAGRELSEEYRLTGGNSPLDAKLGVPLVAASCCDVDIMPRGVACREVRGVAARHSLDLPHVGLLQSKHKTFSKKCHTGGHFHKFRGEEGTAIVSAERRTCSLRYTSGMLKLPRSIPSQLVVPLYSLTHTHTVFTFT
jgi:hypothetical protein